MNKRFYWDTAAGTPFDPRVEKVMVPYQSVFFGNPSSIHLEGVFAQKSLNEARNKVAKILFAHPDEIIFTGGGTEGDNLAIIGSAISQPAPRGHVITTQIEHKAVLEPCRYLAKRGFDVTYLSVDEKGIINLKQLRESLRKDTFLISVIYANNEIGTVEPIKEVAKIIRKWRKDNKTSFPYFHVDACQAPRFLNLNVEQLGVDLMTINGSKIYGPKGIGCLFVRRGVKLSPIFMGGGQESGLRSGTHNVVGIVGLAKALEICEQEKEKESKKLSSYRDRLMIELEKISCIKINGDKENRLPNNINFSIEGMEGEQVVIELDAKGFAVSSGSACAFGSDEGSYVIRALGLDEQRAIGEVRVTLPREVKETEIKLFIKAIKEIIAKYKIAI